MLLTRIFRGMRRDDGAALAAVLGLMAVGLIMTSLILTSVVSGLGFTTSTRAGVQAQAAAEAGVAAARAGLAAGTCSDTSGAPVYTSPTGTSPRYSAAIFRPISGGWEAKCPVGTTTQVKIVSTGFADQSGIVGQGSGNSIKLEAILAATSTPTAIKASGPAVYAYSSTGFGGGGTLYSIDGSSPGVMIKTGNVACTGGASGISNLVVENGTLSIDGGCSITGTAWASGRITTVGGAIIGGSLVGAGVTHGGKTINGNVWSTSDVTIGGGGTIGGTVAAQSLSLTNGNVKGDVWIFGGSVFNWGGVAEKNLTTKTFSKPSGNNQSSFVKGTLTVVPAGPGASTYSTAPARPVVPGWYNLAYDMTKWTGFTELVMPAGTCSYAQLQAKVTAVGTNAAVLDARACTNGVYISGADELELKGDLAIVANKFLLNAGGGFKAPTDQRLWLITPDGNVNDTVPTCPSGSSFVIDGGFDFTSNLSTMVYTPCAVTFSSGIDTLRGQIFVGAATIDGGANIGYEQIGLPGVDLDSGTVAPSTPTSTSRPLVSLRNVTG